MKRNSTLLCSISKLRLLSNIERKCRVYKKVSSGNIRDDHFQHRWSSSLIADTSKPLVVYVDLGMERIFQDINELNKNIEIRGLDYNVYNLYTSYKELKELQEMKIKLIKEKEYIVSKVNKLCYQEKDKEMNLLKKSGRNVRIQLKKINSNCASLEHEVIIEALKLPIALHRSVTEEMFVIKTRGTVKKSLRQNNFAEGKTSQCIKFSPYVKRAFYLKGKMAKVLYNLEQKLEIEMLRYNIVPLVCPNIVMSVIFEGCGQHFISTKGFELQQKLESDEQERYPDSVSCLTGVSPMGFIAYLTRMSLSENSVPLRLYSIGSKYLNTSAETNGIDFINSSQTTILEVFGCAKSETEMEDMYYQYINAMESIYNSFDLPMRMVQTRASDLQVMESARTEMQVWFPSRRKYYKVGSISMWGDYASRRLMITPSKEYSGNNMQFVFTVHGTVVDMPVLIAAMEENYQDQAS